MYHNKLAKAIHTSQLKAIAETVMFLEIFPYLILLWPIYLWFISVARSGRYEISYSLNFIFSILELHNKVLKQ